MLLLGQLLLLVGHSAHVAEALGDLVGWRDVAPVELVLVPQVLVGDVVVGALALDARVGENAGRS